MVIFLFLILKCIYCVQIGSYYQDQRPLFLSHGSFSLPSLDQKSSTISSFQLMLWQLVNPSINKPHSIFIFVSNSSSSVQTLVSFRDTRGSWRCGGGEADTLRECFSLGLRLADGGELFSSVDFCLSGESKRGESKS